MQRTKAAFSIALPSRVTYDRAFKGLPRLDLQPRFVSFPRKIRTVTFFGHDPFEAHLAHGVEQSSSVVNTFAQTIRGIFLDRVTKPVAPPAKGFVNDWPPVEIQAVENVTDRRILCPVASNCALRLLL